MDYTISQQLGGNKYFVRMVPLHNAPYFYLSKKGKASPSPVYFPNAMEATAVLFTYLCQQKGT